MAAKAARYSQGTRVLPFTVNRMEAGTDTGRQPEHLRKNGNKKRQISVRENWRAKNSHYYTELHGTIMPMQCYTCPEEEQCFF